MLSRLIRASEDRDNNSKPAPEVLTAQVCVWQTFCKLCTMHDTAIIMTKKPPSLKNLPLQAVLVILPHEQMYIWPCSLLQGTSPSPLPGDARSDVQLPREVIQQLRDVVFGFDTFYVTAVENYQANGVLFKGNLRGRSPADSYARTAKRFQVTNLIATDLHAQSCAV